MFQATLPAISALSCAPLLPAELSFHASGPNLTEAHTALVPESVEIGADLVEWGKGWWIPADVRPNPAQSWQSAQSWSKSAMLVGCVWDLLSIGCRSYGSSMTGAKFGQSDLGPKKAAQGSSLDHVPF